MSDEREPGQLPPALQPFELTVSPAHFANGCPLNVRASRQELQFRQHATEWALTAEGAIDAYERREDRMVTACTRLQAEREVQS
jgi:hypothetical protein